MAKTNQRVITIAYTIVTPNNSTLTDEQINDLLVVKSKDKYQVKIISRIADPEPA